MRTAAGRRAVTAPLSDNPALLRPDPALENPILVAPGEPRPTAYAEVFDRVLSVVTDYFPIADSNRYDGQIVTRPSIAPGVLQPFRGGSPEPRERLLATLQTYRYICRVRIRTADVGGYLVQVEVFKQLKDDPQPVGAANQGLAVFRETPGVDQVLLLVQEVGVPAPVGERWINKGRDTGIEQDILRRIRRCS